jgi:hypothetical protein
MYEYDALVQNGQNTTHPVTVVGGQHNDSDLKNKAIAEPRPSFHPAALSGRSRNISLALAAVLLHIALVALLVVVVLVPISLTSSGPLSSQNNTLYITGITVIATLATSFTKNQIRELWLRNVDVRLSRGDSPGLTNASWRTALGLASTREIMGHWNIYFTFLAAGLSTTAIVAGLAASPATRLVPYEYLLADAFDYSCVSTSDSITELPHQNPSRIKTRETRLHYQNKMRDKYAKSKAIDEAVAAIKRGEFVHYSDAAKKYKCDRSALSRRVRGLTKTKKDADSFWR